MDLCIFYLLNFVFQILPLQPMTKHFEDIQNLPRRSFLKAVIFSQDMRQAPFNYIFGLKHLTMHAEAPYHARRATARQENAGKAVIEETPEDSRENSEEVIKENVEREASEAPKDVIDTENVDVQLVNDYFYPDPDEENSTVVLELTNIKLKVELLNFHEFEIQ